MIPGNIERLHRDYEIGNSYVIRKYQLRNALVIPSDFEKEALNRLCAFDLKDLRESMDSYFLPAEDGDIFFFTRKMTDEYIAEAVEDCMRELEALENGKEGIDGYASAWNHTYG